VTGPSASDAPRSLIRRIGETVEGPRFQRFVTALIVANAVTLGLETSPTVVDAIGPVLVTFDRFVLAVFVVEILGKLIYRKHRFFLNGWNVFDFIIVAIALIPASGPLAVLRALRVLRTLRLISVVPAMRNVVQALLTAIPGLFSVGTLILLIFYVGGVLATKLFGPDFDAWFGTLGRSMYSLFQIMTLESWSMGIVRPVMEQHPYAWAFFIPFILITTFAILNLFIGIIVDAMQTQHLAENKADQSKAHDERGAILTELAALRAEVAALNDKLEKRS
jgi:voltage-gated sodium channel